MVATRSKAAETAAPEPAAPVEPIDFSSMTLSQRLDKARELLGGGVEKKGQNKSVGDGYSFVKASDVSRQVYDALHRVGVYATPSYKMIDAPVQWPSRSGTLQFMAMLEVTLRIGKVEVPFGTGEVMVVQTVGFGADSGDKGPYKAMTGGLKYALLHAVGLATDDDPEDARVEAVPAAPAEPRRVGPQAAAATPTAPAAAGEAVETTAVGDDPNAPITTAQSRLIFAKSNEAGLSLEQFRSLIFIVTGKRSSKQLVSKEVDEILAGLADEAVVTRAKSDATFDATVGQAPDPTKDPQAEADRIAAEAAALTGGEVIQADAAE